LEIIRMMQRLFFILLCLLWGCGDTPLSSAGHGDAGESDIHSRTDAVWESDANPPQTENVEVLSDDPADYDVDSSVGYNISVSEPRWVVPSDGLPDDLGLMASNNNVDIMFHEERLFMGFRTGPNHFASEETQMMVVSSLDGGVSWQHELKIELDSDAREPRFLSMNGSLQLIFFEAGTNPIAFEPMRMWRTFRQGSARFSELELMVDAPEVPWDVKVRGGVAWMTSYMGDHYGEPGRVNIEVYFKKSIDGLSWQLVDDVPFVYQGGVSEVAFEFGAEGDLWAVTRNEDGDATGFGSHVCWAPADSLGAWECPDVTDPERYDSPELFRHGSEIYLLARRDIGGPFGENPSLGDYSTRPKRTALYRIDQDTRSVAFMMDLPGAGDTAFPSIQRTGNHSFLLANYTSPLDDPDITWIEGQTSELGTQIYLLDIVFQAVE
jgi:hypothetical protein